MAEARGKSKDTEVTVQGMVTHTESSTLIYIQDDTAGIKLDTYGKGVDLSSFKQGDIVKAKGKIDFYKGELEVSVESTGNISKVGTGALPEPKTILINQLADYQGQLVKAERVKLTDVSNNYTFIIEQDGQATKLYHSKAENFNKANYKAGDYYTITGIAAIFDNPQLKLRDGADMVKADPPQDPQADLPLVYNLKPADKASIFAKTPEISATIEKSKVAIDISSIKLTIDGNQVTHQTEDISVNGAVYELVKVSYTPDPALDYGKHKATLEVSDTNGQKQTKEWSFTIQDQNAEYNFYFGVPHSHTSYSDGKGTPTDAFNHAKQNGLDYLIITDHSNWLDGVTDGNYEYNAATDQYEEKDGSEWHKTRQEAEQFNAANNDFLAIRGFEMTSSHWGHINVYNSDSYVEAKSQMTGLNEFYDWLAQQDNVVAAFCHPGWPGDFNNFAYKPELDDKMVAVEVGNGAPPYSYTRFEDDYFTALDNGWHVGAMNAQDNHSNNWGDPDNLTVVLAQELTTDSFMEALKNKRIYSTETRTLELTVKANGHWMGSLVDVKPGDTLQFDIAAQDSQHPIKKVQLITNGGNIAQEQVFNNVNLAQWNPQVTAGSGAEWYVVKVIHADGKWGTASPIFTPGSKDNVKLNGLAVDPSPTLSGYETTLAATVANMGMQAVQDIEVKFYENSVTENNLLGTATINEIKAGESAVAETKWTPTGSGPTVIIAKLTEKPGLTTVTEMSKTIDVIAANGKTVLIDKAHKNADVPDVIGNFMELLRRHGYTVKINEGPITADTLQNVDVLLINTPTEKAKDFTPEEEAVIGTWVNNGGAAMVAAKSNYGNDSTMMNSLLAAMGTGIRFNDDNVYEPEDSDKYSGGMVWSVYCYNLPETPSGLNDNLEAIRIFSGSSLVNADNGALVNNPATGLEILLGGNATSYNANPGANAHVYNEKGGNNGEIIPIIAKENLGQGKVVAAGRHFYSDFEVVNDVSNTALTLKLIDWLAGYDRIKDIKTVRENAEEGDIVTVKGTVTAPSETFFDVIYIQDETSGVSIYGNHQDKKDLPLGTEVIATGKVKYFEGELEIEFDSFDYQVLYVGPTDKIVPVALSTNDAMSEQYTGMLVTASGQVTEHNEAGSYFKIDDGSGAAYIHVDGYVGADMGRFKVGDLVKVTGIASVGAAGPRIRVRFNEDLKSANINEAKIAVFSDPHYFAPELLDDINNAAFQEYLAKDRKLIAESDALLKETIKRILDTDAGIVLVPGDLTKDGELVSHQKFAELLKQLEDAGKKVYVINGNHDVNNSAHRYENNEAIATDNVSPEQFKQIYRDFGYAEAVARDDNSLSYVVEPAPGIRIIVMESAVYGETGGRFSEARLNWIKQQTKEAAAQGKTVLGMMHHGLLDHFTVQRQFFPEYVIEDADRVAEELAAAGMQAVFTGHFHAQDIVSKQFGDKVIYDIQTGSPVTYPNPYRIVELTAANQLEIKTEHITSIDYDLSGPFPDYARNYLVEGLNGLAPQMLAGILIKQGMPQEQAIQQANQLVQQTVASNLTIQDLIVDAFVAHYQGDESINPQLLPVIQGMAASADDLTKMLGGALLSLGTDPAPGDNNVTLALGQTSAAKPFVIISDGKLDRTGGIKATAKVCRTTAPDHVGSEVVVFQLMKGTTPVSIVAMEKEVQSTEELIAHFNEAGDGYLVKVFVFDRFDTDLTNVQINLAEAQVLN
ncbi:MAG: CehA/McbA family metallohydrolase [Bacillota bacterium]